MCGLLNYYFSEGPEQEMMYVRLPGGWVRKRQREKQRWNCYGQG